ncbi:ATP-dependent DNA ligase [Pseudonocardia sp. D17]|uniref:ATP-dependent DNA ligase n=1 Tax=Pseudonocardia sp. D17 TaxID=882661 RepID=UPI002B394501|nr:ATP-dependent DNA ligase [Pseudonocardia sp. D17]
MAARPAEQLPDAERAERFSFEAKLDGFRCIAFIHDGHAVLQSRQQRSLTRYFPEITAALVDQLPDGTVLDGELVIRSGGRLDFGALQRRIHPSAMHAARRSAVTPATFVVFDVLVREHTDMRPEQYRRRRKQLRRLLDETRPPIALMPATRDLAGARAWMAEHGGGIEGVVVKDRRRAYRPDRHAWEKIRIRSAVDAIVGGVIGPLDRPEALILGRRDDRGRLRVAGRTRPLRAAEQAELARVLAPPDGAHPWPPVIPASRFGQLGSDPIVYTKARPDVVVEVDADVCWEHDRWRHAVVYRRVRVDLTADDVARGRPE